jgi:hypothetical protein
MKYFQDESSALQRHSRAALKEKANGVASAGWDLLLLLLYRAIALLLGRTINCSRDRKDIRKAGGGSFI